MQILKQRGTGTLFRRCREVLTGDKYVEVQPSAPVQRLSLQSASLTKRNIS